MGEKHTPLTDAELRILKTGVTENNDQWNFLQDNANRISMPKDGTSSVVKKVESPSSKSVNTDKAKKQVKKVPAQIPSSKLPDIDVSNEYWNK